jgi:hypothetical protein
MNNIPSAPPMPNNEVYYQIQPSIQPIYNNQYYYEVSPTNNLERTNRLCSGLLAIICCCMIIED